MDAAELKELAYSLGADLAGIAPGERFTGLAPEKNPLSIAPKTRSVLVVAQKMLRGSLRGIEEGTNFGSTYQCFGLEWMEDFFLSKIIYTLACKLEDMGIEAVPVMWYKESSVCPDYRDLAEAAGLGSVGKNGLFLTTEYGHRQRFAALLLDQEFAADPVKKVTLCDDCQACITACPLQAISEVDNKITICEAKCRKCRNGAREVAGRVDGIDRFAAQCGRSCMVATEERISEKFAAPFRKRSVWNITPGQENLSGTVQAFVGGVCPKK